MRAGFPHSDIHGSKLVCELPVAFRTLQRPSSPVIAKASTTCTYSLDPITLSSTSAVKPKHRQLSRLCPHPAGWSATEMGVDTITTHASVPLGTNTLYFFQIVKDLNSPGLKSPEASKPTVRSLPNSLSRSLARIGGGERDRTDDLLLAKQALSQLSYTPDHDPHTPPQIAGGSGRT